MPLRLRFVRVSDGARDNREALLKFSVLTLGEATGLNTEFSITSKSKREILFSSQKR